MSLYPFTSLGSFPWHPSLHRLRPELWAPKEPSRTSVSLEVGKRHPGPALGALEEPKSRLGTAAPQSRAPHCHPPSPPSTQGRGCPQLSLNPELPPHPQICSQLSSTAPPASFPLAEQREGRKQTPDTVFLFQGQMYLNNLQSLDSLKVWGFCFLGFFFPMLKSQRCSK